MSDDNPPDSIGGPEPMTQKDAPDLLTWIVSLLSIPVFGLLVFSLQLRPTRTAGGTRSAKLVQRERQAEIQEAVASSPGAENPTASRPNQR
jgi:hypothetical protein